jgi:hypothetical protein
MKISNFYTSKHYKMICVNDKDIFLEITAEMQANH